MQQYKTYMATLALSALVSFLLTPWVRRLAIRWGAMDQPEARKVHRTPMPRMGGLAIVAGFLAPCIAMYFLGNRVALRFQDYDRLMAAFWFASIVTLALGIYDDIKGANALQKLGVQAAVALVLFWGGYQITRLSNPWGNPIELGLLAIPVTMLWMVGTTNAINLLDGIDGLATGVTACIALCLAIINIVTDNILIAILTLSLAGACLGFLPHNRPPARIFLGDTGSLFLGQALACIAVLSLFKAVTAAFVAVPLLLFAIPFFDTLSVMVGRFLRGDPVFRADKTHIHHRLLELGWGHGKAALFLCGLTAIFGAVGTYLSLVQSRRMLQWGLATVAFLVLVLWVALRRQRLK